MNIYVAGKWEDRVRVRQIMDKVEQLGHTVTHDWTAREGDTPEILRECAVADLAGIADSRVLVIVAIENYPYCGTICEMGFALGCDIPVWVVGHGIDNCIFMHLPWVVQWETLDDLYKHLEERAYYGY